jgi:hypothetical protein
VSNRANRGRSWYIAAAPIIVTTIRSTALVQIVLPGNQHPYMRFFTLRDRSTSHSAAVPPARAITLARHHVGRAIGGKGPPQSIYSASPQAQ